MTYAKTFRQSVNSYAREREDEEQGIEGQGITYSHSEERVRYFEADRLGRHKQSRMQPMGNYQVFCPPEFSSKGLIRASNLE